MVTNSTSLLCPAKINLGLRVLNRREDGFHDIDTVFLPMSLSDRLVINITTSSEDDFICTPQVCKPSDNLVIQCLSRYRKLRPDVPSLEIQLIKQIPDKAGLGGGSSNAASMLNWLNNHYPLPMEEIQRLALSLGSDVPFFLSPTPARGQGRGELLTKLEISQEIPILIVKPTQGISTKSAFEWLHQNQRAGGKPLYTEQIVKAVNFKQYRDLFELAPNQFTECFLEMLPEYKSIPNFFLETGADFFSLSGSGSAWYGIYSDPSSRSNAVCKAHSDWQLFVCSSLNSNKT